MLNAPVASRRRTARSRAPHQEVGVLIAHAPSAIDVVQELATEGWRQAMAHRLTAHLGDQLWTEVDQTWHPAHCKRLAKAARNLRKLNPSLSSLDTVLGRQNVRRAVNRTAVGAALVDRVITADTQAEAVVLAMRVTGIALCEFRGWLTHCQCLKDLADETVPAQLEGKVLEVSDGYLTRAG